MRIFLTGGSGFIGSHFLQALVARGHEVTVLVRASARAEVESQAWPRVRIVVGEFSTPQGWIDAVAGHEVVINSVGIIRERGASTFEAVHHMAPIALFDAAQRGGAKRIIQISALGADATATTPYHRTKRAADEHLAQLGVPYVVLRPSIVYGPGDHSMTFFQSLASLPLVFMPGDGRYRLQPVAIEDLVAAVVKAVETPDFPSVTVDVGGAKALSFRELLDLLAARLGRRPPIKAPVPLFVMRRVARYTDHCGGRGPISTDELTMLLAGNAGDNAPFQAAFGIEPVSLEVGLARHPLRTADRWQAGLAMARFPLRASIAFIWLATAIICSTVSAAEGFALLVELGVPVALAPPLMYSVCALEIVIGLMTLFGYRVRLAAQIQLALILGFTAIITLQLPHYWLHPFGPITKNIPLLAATWVMMELERE